jgi:RimJ/RimL family protein N-acetyltransferase
VAILGALARWGASMGAVRAYAQCDQANAPAHRLFDRLGFHRHHSYHYRCAPTID